MTDENETCATCGTIKNAHKLSESGKRTIMLISGKRPCKKFVPQNQSISLQPQAQWKKGEKEAFLRGIFDVSDLENLKRELIGNGGRYKVYTDRNDLINAEIAELEERQRIKAEVVRLIDEIKMYSEDEEDNHFEWIYVEELKKRLGI